MINIIDTKYMIMEFDPKLWDIGIKLLEIGSGTYKGLWCFGFSILCFHFHIGKCYRY